MLVANNQGHPDAVACLYSVLMQINMAVGYEIIILLYVMELKNEKLQSKETKFIGMNKKSDGIIDRLFKAEID